MLLVINGKEEGYKFLEDGAHFGNFSPFFLRIQSISVKAAQTYCLAFDLVKVM
jgi:hypothetical protein